MFIRVVVLGVLLATGVTAVHALNLDPHGKQVTDPDNGKGDDKHEAPEPGTLALLAAGLIGAVGVARALKNR
jgi:hypothetical protein